MDDFEYNNFIGDFKFKYHQVKVMAKYHEYEGKESVRYTILYVDTESVSDRGKRTDLLINTLKKYIQKAEDSKNEKNKELEEMSEEKTTTLK